MNINYILRRMGLIKTPHYSVNFAANNPFTGTWYSVKFEDGRHGMIVQKSDGTYIACPTYIKDTKKTFVGTDSAAESIYSELIRTNLGNWPTH